MRRFFIVSLFLLLIFIPSFSYSSGICNSDPSARGDGIYLNVLNSWFKVRFVGYFTNKDNRSYSDGWHFSNRDLYFVTGGGTDSGTRTYYYIYTIDDDPPSECAEPDHCSNVVKDSDEGGIDCGGSCSATCETYCPSGTQLYSGSCWHSPSPDSFGNCPDGYSRSIVNGSSQACSKNVGQAVVANPDYIDDNQSDYTGGSFSVGHFSSESTSTSQTVDNGDGTVTQVDKTTTTGSDGSSKTTTKTTLKDKATGQVLGSGEKVETETPEEDNPDNYDYGTRLDEVDNSIDSDGKIYAKFSNRFSDFRSNLSHSDIMNFMDSTFDFSGHTGSAVSEVDMGEWGYCSA